MDSETSINGNCNARTYGKCAAIYVDAFLNVTTVNPAVNSISEFGGFEAGREIRSSVAVGRKQTSRGHRVLVANGTNARRPRYSCYRRISGRGTTSNPCAHARRACVLTMLNLRTWLAHALRLSDIGWSLAVERRREPMAYERSCWLTWES
jgi:hypothetical protein